MLTPPPTAAGTIANGAGNGDTAGAVTFEAVQTVTRLDVEERREQALAIYAPLRDEPKGIQDIIEIIQYESSRILYYTY